MPSSRARSFSAPARQRGNALVFALLALVLTGLTVAGNMQGKLLELKQNIGTAEATVLETLKNATNNALLEGLIDIQAGRAFSKNAVSVTPVMVEGELTWSPTPTQLRDMGYLPKGWAATSSSLNNAPYGISFRRVPAGCAAAACVIEGQVVIMGPIRDGSAPDSPVDGVVIGPILTRMGADGGVSLTATRDAITGFDNTWSAPNPVMGRPDGVVAVRVGSGSAGFGQFVRIGDTRDPDLAGNLSVAGNVSIVGLTNFTGKVEMNAGATSGGPVVLKDGSGKECVTFLPGGSIDLRCHGELKARQGEFSDGTPGNSSTIGPGEVRTTGKLSGARLVLTDVSEGAACSAESGSTPESAYAGLAGGGLGMCSGGRWVAVGRFRTAGSACGAEEDGAVATDPADSQGLICRRGAYWRSSALLSNFVVLQSLDIHITGAPVVVNKPQCPSAQSAMTPEALIVLTPNNEDAAVEGGRFLSGINRFAVDNGNSWTVHLERSSDGAALPGTLIATVYCFYR